MTLTTEELDDMSPRQLGRLIEDAGDAIIRDNEATESMNALGDIAAETGHKIVALDGNRINYNSDD